MSKLFEWSRGLWLDAQLAAPSVVQRTVIPRLHEAKEMARLMLRRTLTTYQWQGQSQGGGLTVTYAGLGHGSSFLKDILFTKEPTEKLIEPLSISALGRQVGSLDSDIVIVEAGQQLTRKLPPQGAVALPFRLQHIVFMQPTWDEVWNGFRSSARKQDVRLVKKYGYEYEISHNPADVELFYHSMYVPTTVDRHGDLASVAPLKNLYRYFQHGFLLWIKRDGRPVSGAVCSIQNQMVNLAMTGLIDADSQLMREGAVAAIYYFLLRWAHEAGYQAVNLGFCWPFLKDGIFQFKRKWGAVATIPPREYKQIWFKIQRATPAVEQFCQNNPCVIVDATRQLQGLIFTADTHNIPAEVKAEWQQKYETPGLNNLLIRSVTDFLRESQSKA